MSEGGRKASFSPEELLAFWQAQPSYHGQIVHVEEIPARAARYVPLDKPLPPVLQQALASGGIEALYSHQTQALELAREGRGWVVVTGTASGKSLCYHLPVLETLAADPLATALYLFPTKALAQDQLRSLEQLVRAAGLAIPMGTYDGDTPPQARRRLRQEGRLILTNPDMLSSGILPRHPTWVRFFSHLRFVVVDEIHVYRGIFGANVALVLWRLRRIAAHYGVRPQFFTTSATIGNPLELARQLTGQDLALIDGDGSPRGRKVFVLWNPPRVGPGGERRSANMEARTLMASLVRRGLGTITFVRTRTVAEVLYRYVQEDLAKDGAGLRNAVHSYRGGYLPEERREIERRLFSGELLGVTTTNALELGIDVGGLDAAILVGFPGSIASTWQQAGRAGRSRNASLAVLIAHSSPTDQYLMQHPDYLFGRSPEAAVIDPGNAHLLLPQLRAAALEIPLAREELSGLGVYAPAVAELLLENGQLAERGSRLYFHGGGFPADSVNLRQAAAGTYTILEVPGRTGIAAGEVGVMESGGRRRVRPEPAAGPAVAGSRVIGTVDEWTAFMLVHPEAVYLHNGQTYLVEKLDLAEKTAYVHAADLDYYTQAVTDRQVQVVQEEEMRYGSGSFAAEGAPLQGAPGVAAPEWTWVARFGQLEVRYLTYMFKKIRFYSNESLGFGRLSLPPLLLGTTGFWLTPSALVAAAVQIRGRDPLQGMVGLANAITGVVPLFAMCDPLDVSTAVQMAPQGAMAVFVFDRFPGGAGFAQRVWGKLTDVLQGALELIEGCSCRDGCPSCVGAPVPPAAMGDPDVSAREQIPDKEAARLLLLALLGRISLPEPGTAVDTAAAAAARPGQMPAGPGIAAATGNFPAWSPGRGEGGAREPGPGHQVGTGAPPAAGESGGSLRNMPEFRPLPEPVVAQLRRQLAEILAGENRRSPVPDSQPVL
ncbi:MAG: DEAD/DEAH box helicase [Firmicutes bacterium]|nr:DEAD/DEAH box helicase [Bacillota bacterium]